MEQNLIEYKKERSLQLSKIRTRLNEFITEEASILNSTELCLLYDACKNLSKVFDFMGY